MAAGEVASRSATIIALALDGVRHSCDAAASLAMEHALTRTAAVRDETTGAWISSAEVAETAFTAFVGRKKAERVDGRLVVRRIPELNAEAGTGQQTLFDTHRFHAFCTTSELDTVTADKTHRQRRAWLVLASIAFNLSRAIGTLAGTELGKARSGTIRRKLVTIPARISTSARKIVLHLPAHWPWETGWSQLFEAACGPPRAAAI